MIVLVDMDGVITDLEAEFFRRWKERYGFPLTGERANYLIEHDFPSYREEIRQIMSEPSLFRNLPEMPGATKTLKDLAEENEVHIVTSPLFYNPTCVQDKIEWIVEHLGEEWLDCLVLTRDKTIVRGDVLIDDKIHIQGKHTPTWRHILFHSEYSRSKPHNGHRVETWHDIRQLLDCYTK